jgi:hypothetical protein
MILEPINLGAVLTSHHIGFFRAMTESYNARTLIHDLAVIVDRPTAGTIKSEHIDTD